MTPKVDHTEQLRAAMTAVHTAREAETAALARAREAVLALLADGASELSLSRETGLSRTTIRTWRREAEQHDAPPGH